MSIESIVSRAEGSAALLPPSFRLAPPDAPANGVVERPASQQRRLWTTRDLEPRLRELEQEFRKFGEHVSHVRQATFDHLRELQQRSSSLTTEILRTGARLAQQGRSQHEDQQRLEQQLQARLQQLEQARLPLATAVAGQEADLQSLQQRVDALDHGICRQARHLELLSSELQQGMEFLRTALADQGEEAGILRRSLLALTLAHDELALSAQDMQRENDRIHAELQVEHRKIQRRLAAVSLLLAAMALSVVGGALWQLWQSLASLPHP